MKTIRHSMNFLLTILFIAVLSSCEERELDMNEPGNLVPLLVIEDPGLPSITINGTQLHSETFGNPSDPMIVAIHGGPGGDYRSILNCKEFANDGFFVVFYDQRGSGLSQRHNTDIYNVQIYIDDLGAVIEHYRQSENQKVILMGHSWGAMVATEFVNQYPEQIDGLVLMEPGGFTWDVTLDYINRSRPMELFNETVNDYVYLDQFITSDQHNVLDYKANLNMFVSFADGNEVGNAGPYPFWRNGAVCNSATIKYAEENSFDFTANLSQFTNKVLFTYSELNKAYGLEHAELVSSAFPNVQLVKIDGTGHEIPYFGWSNFYPVALSYLNETIQ